MLYVSVRSVLTGYMSGTTAAGEDIGAARVQAQALADSLYTGSVWLTTGHPDVRFAAVLETFPCCRVQA